MPLRGTVERTSVRLLAVVAAAAALAFLLVLVVAVLRWRARRRGRRPDLWNDAPDEPFAPTVAPMRTTAPPRRRQLQLVVTESHGGAVGEPGDRGGVARQPGDDAGRHRHAETRSRPCCARRWSAASVPATSGARSACPARPRTSTRRTWRASRSRRASRISSRRWQPRHRARLPHERRVRMVGAAAGPVRARSFDRTLDRQFRRRRSETSCCDVRCRRRGSAPPARALPVPRRQPREPRCREAPRHVDRCSIAPGPGEARRGHGHIVTVRDLLRRRSGSVPT